MLLTCKSIEAEDMCGLRIYCRYRLPSALAGETKGADLECPSFPVENETLLQRRQDRVDAFQN